MVMSVKEWRRYRDQAGVLYVLMMEAPRGRRREARKIYREWQAGRLTFSEAREMLEEILRAGKSK